MKIKFPYPLSDDITATLSLDISVGKEMRMQAGRLGYGPDELANLINQKTQEIAQAVADVIGFDYTPEE